MPKIAITRRRPVYTFILLLIVVGSFVYRMKGFDPPIPPFDDSILTKQPCILPCWYGLIPAETPLETVQIALETIPFTASADIINERIAKNSSYISLTDSHSFRSRGSFEFRDNKLYSIFISPNIAYDLEDILERYGTPSGIIINYHLVSNEVLNEFLDLTVYYPQYGLIAEFKVYHGKQGRNRYLISPELRGVEFRIYPKSQTLEQLVAYRHNLEVNQAPFFVDYLFETNWPGLYSTIVWPSPDTKPPVKPHIEPVQFVTTPIP